MPIQSRIHFALLSSKRRAMWAASAVVLFLAAGLLAENHSGRHPSGGDNHFGDDASEQRIAEGREIFRYDTFGDEQNWTTACACTKSSRPPSAH